MHKGLKPQKLFKHLFNSSLTKDLSILISGTVISQLIPILLQPVLKRMFTPEEFGMFDLYYKIVGLLAIIFTLRYEKAIVLCASKVKSYSLLMAVIVLSATFTLFATFLFFILFHFVPDLIKISLIQRKTLLLAPLGAFFFTVNISMQSYFIREKKFKNATSLKIIRRIGEGISQIIMGLIKSPFGLAVGDMVGNLVASLWGINKIKIKKRNKLGTIKRLATRQMRDYSDLPKYSLLSNFLNTFVLSAITFQVYSKFTIDEVGYLELTQRMLIVPAALIGTSIGQLSLQKSSNLYNAKRSILPTLLTFTFIGIVVTFPFFIIIYYWGENLFSFIFGNSWRISGTYAKQLLLSSCIMFIISPLGQFLIGIKKIKQNSYWEYLKFLTVSLLFFFTYSSVSEYLRIYNKLLIVIYLVYFSVVFFSVYNHDKTLKSK